MDSEADPPGAGRSRHRLRVAGGVLLIATILVAAVLISGTVGGSSDPPPPTAAQLQALPGHLAADSRQADKVIDGSIQARIAALRGIPVVVNQWASWCPSCREEFPLFRQLGKELEGRVAFLGLDSEDDRSKAEAFLSKYPVPYPSVFDPDAGQASSIGGGKGWPTTFFYDRDGGRTYVREGGYVTAETLRADIEQYALGASAAGR